MTTNQVSSMEFTAEIVKRLTENKDSVWTAKGLIETFGKDPGFRDYDYRIVLDRLAKIGLVEKFENTDNTKSTYTWRK